jgi:hypothetical protein
MIARVSYVPVMWLESFLIRDHQPPALGAATPVRGPSSLSASGHDNP